jgi:hypothetical protein
MKFKNIPPVPLKIEDLPIVRPYVKRKEPETYTRVFNKTKKSFNDV